MRPVANETREVVTALRTYGVTSPPHPDGADIGPDSAKKKKPHAPERQHDRCSTCPPG